MAIKLHSKLIWKIWCCENPSCWSWLEFCGVDTSSESKNISHQMKVQFAFTNDCWWICCLCVFGALAVFLHIHSSHQCSNGNLFVLFAPIGYSHSDWLHVVQRSHSIALHNLKQPLVVIMTIIGSKHNSLILPSPTTNMMAKGVKMQIDHQSCSHMRKKTTLNFETEVFAKRVDFSPRRRLFSLDTWLSILDFLQCTLHTVWNMLGRHKEDIIHRKDGIKE